MRKVLVLFLVMFFVLSMNVFAAGLAEKEETKEIRVLSAVTGGKDTAENSLFEEALEKGTGLSISFEKVSSGYDQVLLQKLGAGERYDLIYFNQMQMYSFASQGIILDLTEMIGGSAIYRDNVSKDEIEKIRFNGKLYAGFNKIEGFPLVNVNKAITDKVGIDLSKLSTLDDYYNMLKSVKRYMEEVEGRKPYYPFFAYMPDIWDLQPWFSSAGLRRGVFVDQTGKKYSPYVDDAALPVWEWLAKLYAEELMDPASFTGKTADMRNKMWQSQDIVMDVDWFAWTGLYNNNAKVAGTYPEKVNVVGLPGTKSPDGNYLLEQGGASLWGIPSNARYPEEAFSIIEYFATAEGGLLLSAGIEGVDYNMVNGKPVFTETGISHGKDHGAPLPVSEKFDMALLGEMNPGAAESLAVGQRPDVLVAPMGYANGELDTRQYYDIMSKWMSSVIMDRISPASGLDEARKELRSKGFID